MFEILPLTPELLAELGDELGGCDFTDPSQIDFLAKAAPCDVQAAPGNGKTTLLAAKLALLSRNWTTRRRGVCVISHTNAARTEVEDLIARHPTAARLMAYPHFTGTVTAFINQYLALPYLRGLGWHVRQIDDDAFAAEALRRYPSFWALKKQAERAGATVAKWVGNLTLDPAFDDVRHEPESLIVQRQKGQHGADTDCGKALSKLKAAMVKSGIYRYADMTALAWRALRENPALAERLRDRFPLVILDEAQDTHGDQLRLLEHVFKQDGAAFQRLGDSNQTLYEDDGAAPAYWTPGPECIPLDTSRRFGGEIAGFASRLTARQAQTIVGLGARPASRVMFLFDEASIGRVLGAFAEEARALWGGDCSTRDVWAVASRHNLAGKKGHGGLKVSSTIIPHIAARADLDRKRTSFAGSFRRLPCTMPRRDRPRRSVRCSPRECLDWRGLMVGKRRMIVLSPRTMSGRRWRIATSRCPALYVDCCGTMCLPALRCGKRRHGWRSWKRCYHCSVRLLRAPRAISRNFAPLSPNRRPILPTPSAARRNRFNSTISRCGWGRSTLSRVRA